MRELAGIFTKSLLGVLLLCFLSTAVIAQEGGSETSSSTTSTKTEIKVADGDNWYMSPWVWVVGGAVFILLLVALTRGGGSSRRDSGTTERVTVTKTVDRDSSSDTRV